MDKPRHVRVRVGRAAARKLTDAQVKNIRRDRAAGFTYKKLSEKYGLAKSTLSYIFNEAKY